MFKKVMSTIVLMLALVGCKSTLMEVDPQQKLATPEPGKTQVVFMRWATFGGANPAYIYDVSSGKPEFIGVVANRTKLVYETEPGQHMFMVIGESADFLKAELAENENYYSIVEPRTGIFSARFSLKPVRAEGSTKDTTYGSKQFNRINKLTEFVLTGEKAQKWARKKAKYINKQYNEYLPKWKGKDTVQQAEATILVNDHL